MAGRVAATAVAWNVAARQVRCSSGGAPLQPLNSIGGNRFQRTDKAPRMFGGSFDGKERGLTSYTSSEMKKYARQVVKIDLRKYVARQNRFEN